MIAPTVGRIVWIRNRDPQWGHPEAAMVAHCWESLPGAADWCLNVGGLDRTGKPFALEGVPLIQTPDVLALNRLKLVYAEWMPYQKGQAAKTEALQDDISRLRFPDTTVS